MSTPGKRATRLGSVAEANKVATLYKKREYYMKAIKRIEEQCDEEAKFLAWSKGEISERIDKLKETSMQLESVNMNIMCDDEDFSNEQVEINEKTEDRTISLKARLIDRLEALNKLEQMQTPQVRAEPLRIEVQTTESKDNWGTFDGDYAQWKSFRDLWVSAMHNNNKISAVTKFQNLKKACKGAAAGALGEWDLTAENYEKAWERLQAIYEDDYMQVHAFMQKLNKIPNMRNPTSKTIRDLIDTVHKHIHGLQRYVKTDDRHPYVVFAIIDRMDTDTYRAWEKYRPSLAKANAQEQESNEEEANVGENANGNQHRTTGKHIPTWAELEEFLEGEVTIRVHAEKRSATNPSESNNNAIRSFKRSKGQSYRGNKSVPDFLQCILCEGVHPIYKCESFKAMSLVGRKNHVNQNDLCERCLRKNHNGQCEYRENNEECPKCKPAVKLHNSMLCPNRELKARLALLTRENQNNNRKRRNPYDNKFDKQGKRKRWENKDYEEKKDANKVGSSIKKVGDWNLVSNAVKQMKSKPTGELGNEYATLLATAKIKIKANNNNDPIDCRAIVDTGASLNCVTQQFINENAISTIKCQKTILGVTGPEIIKQKFKARIYPWFTFETSVEAEFFVLGGLDGKFPHDRIEASKSEIIHLGLADEEFDVPTPVDALVGAEVYANIVRANIYRHKDGAIMQATCFGHIILGNFLVKNEVLGDLPILSVMQNGQDRSDSIAEILSKFWEIEEINRKENKALITEEEKAVDDLFANTHYRDTNGRYVVRIPIKPGCKGLGESRNRVLNQFLQLEKRFERKPELRQKYVEFMRSYMQLGYMQPASSTYDAKWSYWLPHHAVEKKFRVVFNASFKTTSGESLNSIQMVGRKMQYDLQLQIMRFRRHKIGIAIDISKMFNRIGVHPEQWDLQRIFWRESPNDPLKEYVLTVVTFGLASSAHNAVSTLNQCAKDYEKQFPEAAKAIMTCFYMDDGTFGSESMEEAKILCKEIEFVLNQGCLPIKNWLSNSKEIEKYMNTESQNATLLGEKDEEKILGLCWLKTTDELTIVMRQPIEAKNKLTKRDILSEIAKLYDPNGFIAPIIITSKILMQDIWRLNKVDWDDEVPEEIKVRWLGLVEELPRLNRFRIKRWLGTAKARGMQLHAFCDASEKAYGIAIYVRTINGNGEATCALLSAKSRVAPLRTISIPRLELLAAVMLSEQLEAIIEACEFQAVEATLWSDSIVVLHWLNKQPYELKAFVANRVKAIQEKTENFKWKHVKSSDNPADLVSRGIKMNNFIGNKFWLEGPQWLKQNEAKWPVSKLIVSTNEKKAISNECKKNVSEAQIFIIHSGEGSVILYNKFQDWDTLLCVTAYVFRVRKKIKKVPLAGSAYITAMERKKATEHWVKFEQRKAFKKEIKCLKEGDMLPSKSEIAALRPKLDEDDILRVGGRIDKANIAYEKRHQYIIPPKSRLAWLLLTDMRTKQHCTEAFK